jgi:hypothetical protein
MPRLLECLLNGTNIISAEMQRGAQGFRDLLRLLFSLLLLRVLIKRLLSLLLRLLVERLLSLLLRLLLRLLISRGLNLLLGKCLPAEEQGSSTDSQRTAYANVEHGAPIFSHEG